MKNLIANKIMLSSFMVKCTNRSDIINYLPAFIKESDESTDNSKAHRLLGHPWPSPYRKCKHPIIPHYWSKVMQYV